MWPFVQRNVEEEEPALNIALEVAMTDLTGTE